MSIWLACLCINQQRVIKKTIGFYWKSEECNTWIKTRHGKQTNTTNTQNNQTAESLLHRFNWFDN